MVVTLFQFLFVCMPIIANLPLYFYLVIVLFLSSFSFYASGRMYEGESISDQPNLFPVDIHLFFFDVIAL